MGGNFLGAARKRNREDHRKLELILGGTGTSDGLGEGNTAQDFEFPFVRFEDIVVATEISQKHVRLDREVLAKFTRY